MPFSSHASFDIRLRCVRIESRDNWDWQSLARTHLEDAKSRKGRSVDSILRGDWPESRCDGEKRFCHYDSGGKDGTDLWPGAQSQRSLYWSVS